MRLSTKGRYGLRALVDLAAHEEGEAVSLARTAQRQKLSLNYLEQVFGMLRRAGIVTGVKGSNGGFRLTRDMDEITVKEVLEALEGKFSIVDESDKDTQDPVQSALSALLWDEIDRRVDHFLQEKTLGSLVREYRRNLDKDAAADHNWGDNPVSTYQKRTQRCVLFLRNGTNFWGTLSHFRDQTENFAVRMRRYHAKSRQRNSGLFGDS